MNPYKKVNRYLLKEKTISKQSLKEKCIKWGEKITQEKGYDEDWFFEAIDQAEYVKRIENNNSNEEFYVLSMRAYLNYTQEKNIKSTTRLSILAIIIALSSVILDILLKA